MTRKFFLLPTVILLAASIGAFAADDFRVTDAGGETAVIPAGSETASPAKAGLPLNPGDRIVTGAGGKVEVTGKNGTMFRLGANSAFSIEESSSRWTSFRLHVGRVLAKFAPSTGRTYRVNTPVAVASVRGTELALDVSETGALQGGVVEGQVDFEAPGDSGVEWAAESVVTSSGITINPGERPSRLSDIPAPLRPSLAEFPSIRERVPQLRDSWKDLNIKQRETLRAGALRARIRWTVPRNLRDEIVPPRNRSPRLNPEKQTVPKPRPPRPGKSPRSPEEPKKRR